MSRVIAAHTKADPSFPGFVNVSAMSDGTVAIVMRTDPHVSKGIFICGHRTERGMPGRCTPGDENCNNYCNMAKEKGAMQDAPKPCDVLRVGVTTRLVLSAEAWADIRAAIIADMGRVDTAPEG